MFRGIFGNMFSDSSDDYLTAMAMSMFFSFNKKDNNNIKVMYSKKPTEEGRRILNQIKEQAEDVDYEEICN